MEFRSEKDMAKRYKQNKNYWKWINQNCFFLKYNKFVFINFPNLVSLKTSWSFHQAGPSVQTICPKIISHSPSGKIEFIFSHLTTLCQGSLWYYLILYIIIIYLKGIVGAVGIFDHGSRFGIIFLVSDHPAHKKHNFTISDWLAKIINLFKILAIG